MVTIDKIERGVATYLDNELMPQLPSTGIEKVMAGTAIGLLIRRFGFIIESYKGSKTVQLLGIMDEEGNVDVDIVADELKKNIPPEGIKMELPVIGNLKFHKDDITKLHEYIIES